MQMRAGNPWNLALGILIAALIVNNVIFFIFAKNNMQEPQYIKSDKYKQIIFESDNEKIKKYSVYAFAVFIFISVIFSFILKLRKNGKENNCNIYC